MKKFKGLAAALIAMTLTAGNAGVAFAGASPQSQPTLGKLASSLEAVSEPSSVSEPSKETTAAPVGAKQEEQSYPSLRYSEKNYYNENSALVGKYPVVDQVSGLTKKIEDALWKSYIAYTQSPEASDESDSFAVSYELEENGQYSAVIVSVKYKRTSLDPGPAEDLFTYYVNRADFNEVTKERYDEAVKKAEDAADATKSDGESATDLQDEKTESIPAEMIPLRSNTDILGYTLEWNGEDKSIKVFDGEKLLSSVKIGENNYGTDENGNVIKLDSAPTLSDNGVTFVPASYFAKILKAELGQNENGKTAVKKR
ncbi:MAG: copper amine oxidase N-terminal domain-containing protein [Clostridiales bacterium]|nr:copper amine oxidase N-terminal domain-containing protein [Clostridiales bacterium]